MNTLCDGGEPQPMSIAIYQLSNFAISLPDGLETDHHRASMSGSAGKCVLAWQPLNVKASDLRGGAARAKGLKLNVF
ncbi:hypothetical protein [Rugamonas apoptosis]|uniref:Uncharacterized protein n=1 Tax=Rugamonas apoptosis TaxID=2758570 RepID=A0A7W2IK01_9BURK|nr:hypothetical protein [Rugamonas apoptosis]MBA5687063.1 hypothetical protein [Rugamonas apoptosis]